MAEVAGPMEGPKPVVGRLSCWEASEARRLTEPVKMPLLVVVASPDVLLGLTEAACTPLCNVNDLCGKTARMGKDQNISASASLACQSVQI